MLPLPCLLAALLVQSTKMPLNWHAAAIHAAILAALHAILAAILAATHTALMVPATPMAHLAMVPLAIIQDTLDTRLISRQAIDSTPITTI